MLVLDQLCVLRLVSFLNGRVRSYVPRLVAEGAPTEGSSLELTEREARCYKCQLERVPVVRLCAVVPCVRLLTLNQS